MAKVYELKNIGDSRKSFYGKAHIIEERGKKYLQSYDTIVCSINRNGKLQKHWDGYSATTMRHINSFCNTFGIMEGGKKWWDSLKTEKIKRKQKNAFDTLYV